MMSDKTTNHRQFFRLRYPNESGPVLAINDVCYRVSEISEKGLRIICREFGVFRVQEKIGALLFFSDGEEVPITGRVIRHEKEHYVLGQVSGLTFNRLMIEQRNSVNKFAN